MFAHKLSGNWKQLEETELFLFESVVHRFQPVQRNCYYRLSSQDERRNKKPQEVLGKKTFWHEPLPEILLVLFGFMLPRTCMQLQSDNLWGVSSSSSSFWISLLAFCRRESNDRIVLRHASHAQGSTNHDWLESRLLLFFNPNLWCNASSLNDDFVIKWGSRSCVENFSLHRWRNFFSLVMMHFTIEDE